MYYRTVPRGVNLFSYGSLWSIWPQTTPFISHGIAQLLLHRSSSCFCIVPALIDFTQLIKNCTSWTSPPMSSFWIPFKCLSIELGIRRFSQCVAYSSQYFLLYTLILNFLLGQKIFSIRLRSDLAAKLGDLDFQLVRYLS